MRKKPNKECLDAVKALTDFHEGGCASYYSSGDGSAVIVINDADLSQRVLFMIGMLIEDEEDIIEEIDGVPVMTPIEPIES